jgi:hypothetical protein
LGVIVLAVELFLSLARPIYLLSSLATVAILVAFVRGVRGRLIPEPRWRRSPLDSLTLEMRSISVWPSLLIVLLAAVIVVAVDLATPGGKHGPPPVEGLLNAPLARAEKAVQLPPTDVTLVLSLDTSAGRWREQSVALAVRASPHRTENRRIARTLAAIGWTVLPPRIGPDGNPYLRYQRPATEDLAAHLPSVTDWKPSTTIPLGVPDTFPLGGDSRVLLRAPSGLVGSTQPATAETVPAPGSGTTITVIAFDSNTLGLGVTIDGWVQRHPGVRSLATTFLPVLLPSGLAVSLFTWVRRRRKRDPRDGITGETSGARRAPWPDQATGDAALKDAAQGQTSDVAAGAPETAKPASHSGSGVNDSAQGQPSAVAPGAPETAKPASHSGSGVNDSAQGQTNAVPDAPETAKPAAAGSSEVNDSAQGQTNASPDTHRKRTAPAPNTSARKTQRPHGPRPPRR